MSLRRFVYYHIKAKYSQYHAALKWIFVSFEGFFLISFEAFQ